MTPLEVAWSVVVSLFWFGALPLGLVFAAGGATGWLLVLVLRARGYWDDAIDPAVRHS